MIKYLLIFWFVGCGQAYHSPEVTDAVNEFEATYNRSAGGVSITFVDTMPQGVVGLCAVSSWHRDITILTQYWSTSSDTSRKNLVFHELGHCVFNRVHRPDLYADGCPVSIMNPDVISDHCYYAHTSDLVQELPNQ